MKLDRNTLGDSPACLYLIDVLNESTNEHDKNILKTIAGFKNIFTELIKAHEAGAISNSVVYAFITYKRQDLEIQTTKLLAKGYTPLVVNLYKNVVIAELKKFQRRAVKIHQVEKSASDRAKSMLRNKHLKFHNQSIQTYGKSEGESFELKVEFNRYGQPCVQLDKDLIKDSITSESLMEKSKRRLAKLEAQGKIPLKKVNN